MKIQCQHPPALPFDDHRTVTELLEKQGVAVYSSGSDVDCLSANAWWLGTVRRGEWEACQVVLEWDRMGWRWGMAVAERSALEEHQVSLEARMPLAGTVDEVVGGLVAVLTQRLTKSLTMMGRELDTLGMVSAQLEQVSANVFAASAAQLASAHLTLRSGASTAAERISGLHQAVREDGTGRMVCMACAGMPSHPCPTVQHVQQLELEILGR